MGVHGGCLRAQPPTLHFTPHLLQLPRALPSPRELGLQHLSTQLGFSALCWDVAPALPPLILALPGVLLPRANGAVSINSQHPSLLPSSARTVRLHEAAAGRCQSCVSHRGGLHQGGQIRGIWGLGLVCPLSSAGQFISEREHPGLCAPPHMGLGCQMVLSAAEES